MDLKELNPAVFYLYMDNPPLLDLLIGAAIDLDDRRMLKPTLQELASVGVYTKLACELDRFGLWLANNDIVSVEKMGARLTLNRQLNPVAQKDPHTLMGILKSLEVCVEQSNIEHDIKVKMVQRYAQFFPLFNKTLLQ